MLDDILLFVFGILGMLTIFNVSVLLAASKRDWHGMWFWFVVIPVYFVIVALSHGGFYDLFYNPAWTLPFVLVVFIIVFPILGFKFPVSNPGLWIAAALYFVGTWYNMVFANVLGVALFMLIGTVGFSTAAYHALKNIFSDKA